MGGKRRKPSKDYSRRGCVACKKSHVKCDEKLPKCSRCTRRNTDCQYITNFMNNVVDLNNNKGSDLKKQVIWGPNPFSLTSKPTLPDSTDKASPPNIVFNASPYSEFTPTNLSNSYHIPSFEESPYSVSLSETSEGSYIVSPSFNYDHLLSIQEGHLKESYSGGDFQFQNIELPNLLKFDIPWDGGPCVNFINKIEKNDPLSSNHSIAYNNQELVDFIWTMSRITKFFFTFVLFPEDSMTYIHDTCFKLNAKFPVMQSVINYHASLHICRLYHQGCKFKAHDVWEKTKIISFKQCIEFLKDGLESASTFVEFVVLTFTVVIIFSGNANNSSWRAHLTGCYQLINKCQKLVPQVNHQDALEVAALGLFNVIIEWYDYTSYMAVMSSLNGFAGKMLTFSISESFKSVAIPNNGVNLLSGQCTELDKFSKLMCKELHAFEKKGVRLSGLNCAYFVLTHQHPVILKEVQEKGLTLLQKVYEIKSKYKYQRLNSDNFKMDLTLRMCNNVSFQGMELYLKFFLVGERDPMQVRELLRDILDSFYSMPFKSSCSILRHWIIYIASIVALIQNEMVIYQQFIAILELLRANGMEITSIHILDRVRQIIANQTYQDLLFTDYDVVIY